MTRDKWNPLQYERFKSERAQPFHDLLALVRPEPNMRVADLGCGTGELTRRLHETLGARETVGIDTSEAMLEKSTEFAGSGVRFEQGNIAAFQPSEPYDLLFSNAALHWVPGHTELLARLSASLSERGQLAVQVPANDDHPSQSTAREVATEELFADALGGYVGQRPVLRPEEYSTLLYRLGFREQHVRLQVYGHLLASRQEVVEWVKGTTLTPYQERLRADLYDRFLARYRDVLLPRLEDTQPYYYTFKRILFWARR